MKRKTARSLKLNLHVLGKEGKPRIQTILFKDNNRLDSRSRQPQLKQSKNLFAEHHNEIGIVMGPHSTTGFCIVVMWAAQLIDLDEG